MFTRTDIPAAVHGPSCEQFSTKLRRRTQDRIDNCDLAKLGAAPVAMVFDRATEIQVQSTILTQIPAVYGLKKSAIKAIKSGERVKVDADDGPVEILD